MFYSLTQLTNNLAFVCKKLAELPHIDPINAESEVFEGYIFQITCVAPSDPHPTITWLKDGLALADPSISVSYPSPMMSLLIIAQSQRKHAGEYTCVASNPAGQVTKSSRLKVKGFCLSFSVSSHFLQSTIQFIELLFTHFHSFVF